jgi:hypothetical protein
MREVDGRDHPVSQGAARCALMLLVRAILESAGKQSREQLLSQQNNEGENKDETKSPETLATKTMRQAGCTGLALKPNMASPVEYISFTVPASRTV